MYIMEFMFRNLLLFFFNFGKKLVISTNLIVFLGEFLFHLINDKNIPELITFEKCCWCHQNFI